MRKAAKVLGGFAFFEANGGGGSYFAIAFGIDRRFYFTGL